VQTDNIRDVVAFPKTSAGTDPMMGAPSPVPADQLAELGLQLVPGAGD
jgi:aspartyl-tRNA synthetase